MALMEFKLKPPIDGIIRVAVSGRLSRDEWLSRADPLLALCGAGVFQHPLLCDLSGANYLDSTGVDWLFNYHKQFRAGGGRFVCHSAPPATMQLLRLMKLDKVLLMVETERDALDRAREPNPEAQP
jgi:anti-anti-sigma regulatory factor